jgi:hypothetical protein
LAHRLQAALFSAHLILAQQKEWTMKPILNQKQLERAGTFIFQHGRLLERQLYATFFQDGTREACIKALLAYQNPDGGFGNGIEPDLLCPASSAIGAESAMGVLDLLDVELVGDEGEIVDRLVGWIVASQDERGVIPHPPMGLLDYPHQPWWEGPDDARILTLAGLLRKWGVEAPALYAQARRYYLTCAFPDKWEVYNYPFYVYLKYCGEGSEDERRMAKAHARLPAFLQEGADHYPLYSRYWYHAADAFSVEVLHREAQLFVDALQPDGALETPYPDLPWWRPIFTLDGLMVMKRLSLI